MGDGVTTDPTIRLLVGHALDMLKTLPDASVHSVVTSPPYQDWGLRDYSRCECSMRTRSSGGDVQEGDIQPAGQSASLAVRLTTPDPNCPTCHGTGRDESLDIVWDAKEGCEHDFVLEEIETEATPNVRWQHVTGGATHDNRYSKLPDPRAAVEGDRIFTRVPRGFCRKCGAWRGQLGLEPTPDLYVQHLVQVFREVRRVLRDDGVLFLNMGDCYAGSWGNQGRKSGRGSQRPINGPMLTPTDDGRYPEIESGTGTIPENDWGLKPKDLVGMPWRIAFALQADGWWLRSDIIWAKRNSMPESIADRPTKSHEYIFLMTKSRTYFYDADAIREPLRSSPSDLRKMIEGRDRLGGKSLTDPDPLHAANKGTHIGNKRGVGDPEAARVALARSGNKERKFRGDYGGVEDSRSHSGFGVPWEETPGLGRNARTVWDIAVQPYPEAHFATFPERLVEPCIKAGTSEKGCCAECGTPWERVVDARPNPSKASFDPDSRDWANANQKTSNPQSSASLHRDPGGVYREARTVGWQPGCDHEGDPIPCTVLDPFAGSGTTGAVARSLGRSAVLIELKEAYADLIRNRCDMTQSSLGAFDGRE